jgi:hypothetical protein
MPYLSDPGSFRCFPDIDFLLGYQPGSSSGYEIPHLLDPGIFSAQAKTLSNPVVEILIPTNTLLAR